MRDSYEAANDKLTYMTPEMLCLEDVQQKGFVEQFRFENAGLVCTNNERTYQPDEISVINFYRFEGISDPDDMSIIYVIETSDGHKGTLVDAYGVYADEDMGAFMNQVGSFEKKTVGEWGKR
jgi:hypothetical protein